MKVHFSISELCITGADVPQKVADKLLKFHIQPMNPVRETLDIAITASQNSGYRPYPYEKSRGRSGTSQHTFGERSDGTFDPSAKGAVDWTCHDFTTNKDKLLEEIIKQTDYTRMAVYSGFIHCDYKPTKDGNRKIYKSGSNSKWEWVKDV